MNKKYLFLSPHFDDAVLSCGSYINNLISSDNNVTVLTICAGEIKTDKFSNLANGLHSSWGVDDPAKISNIRKKEDIEALKVLNCDYIHLSIPDCIYRINDNGMLIYDFDQFEPVLSYSTNENDIHPIDILNKIAKTVDLESFETIFVPIGAGGHIDHILTRMVGEQLFKKSIPVIFYDEIYSLQNGALQKALDLNEIEFSKFYVKVNRRDIEQQVIASKKYSSQVPGLEDFYEISIEEMCSLFASYGNGKYKTSIRLWKPSTN